MDEQKIPIRPVLIIPLVQGQPTFVGCPTQTTVGAAGGASALPATPTGYIKFVIDNTEFAIPFYAVS